MLPDHAVRGSAVSSGPLQPAAGVAEHDDVAAVDLVRTCRRACSTSTRSSTSSVFSIEPGRDEERLHEEGLDEHRDHQGGDHDAGQLAPERLALRRGPAGPRRGRSAGLGGGTSGTAATGGQPTAAAVVGRHRGRPSVPGRRQCAPRGRALRAVASRRPADRGRAGQTIHHPADHVSSGTVPPPGDPEVGPGVAESERWSPISHSLPSGHVDVEAQLGRARRPGYRYDDSSQRAAVDRRAGPGRRSRPPGRPPTPITRLT